MYFLLWNLKVADIKILSELSWWKCGVEGEETELQMQVDLTSSESLCSIVLPFGNKSNCWYKNKCPIEGDMTGLSTHMPPLWHSCPNFLGRAVL